MTDAPLGKFQDRFDAVVFPAPSRLFLWLLVGFVALVGALIALPDRPYLRFQNLAETIHNRVQWSYERLHFDPTPIDVAVIGNSRMGAGVNAPALSAALSAALSEKLGRPIHVVNLSTPQEGRDMHWIMARELIETRPEVSFILLSLTEQEPRVSHPAFASLASRADILTAPLLLNRDWLANVAYLPYRQLTLFLKGLSPGLFGMHDAFDPGRYSGPDYDTTTSFTLPDGGYVDRDTIPDPVKLGRIANMRVHEITPPLLPEAFADNEFVMERAYTRKIADLAAAHGIGVGFIYLPIYGNEAEISHKSFYSAIGPVYEARQLIHTPQLFSDYGHLNHEGAKTLVPWLADQILQSLTTHDFHLKTPS